MIPLILVAELWSWFVRPEAQAQAPLAARRLCCISIQIPSHYAFRSHRRTTPDVARHQWNRRRLLLVTAAEEVRWQDHNRLSSSVGSAGAQGRNSCGCGSNPSALSERQRASAVVVGRDGRLVRTVGYRGTIWRWSRRQAVVPNTGTGEERQ